MPRESVGLDPLHTTILEAALELAAPLSLTVLSHVPYRPLFMTLVCTISIYTLVLHVVCYPPPSRLMILLCHPDTFPRVASL